MGYKVGRNRAGPRPVAWAARWCPWRAYPADCTRRSRGTWSSQLCPLTRSAFVVAMRWTGVNHCRCSRIRLSLGRFRYAHIRCTRPTEGCCRTHGTSAHSRRRRRRGCGSSGPCGTGRRPASGMHYNRSRKRSSDSAAPCTSRRCAAAGRGTEFRWWPRVRCLLAAPSAAPPACRQPPSPPCHDTNSSNRTGSGLGRRQGPVMPPRGPGRRSVPQTRPSLPAARLHRLLRPPSTDPPATHPPPPTSTPTSPTHTPRTPPLAPRAPCSPTSPPRLPSCTCRATPTAPGTTPQPSCHPHLPTPSPALRQRWPL